MTEDMNRFGYNTEGKICDYGYEEPKVLTEQEILEELNHLENTKNHFWEECEDVNWQNECLQEQLDKAIVPKFNIGQEVWFINYFSDCGYRVDYGKVVEIKINEYDKTLYEIAYKYKGELDFKSRKYTNVFATEEEARAKLKELQNE